MTHTIHVCYCNHTYIHVYVYTQNLNKLAELVRGEMAKLSRKVIGALITIDVHARDIVTQMVTNKVNWSLLICMSTRVQIYAYNTSIDCYGGMKWYSACQYIRTCTYKCDYSKPI